MHDELSQRRVKDPVREREPLCGPLSHVDPGVAVLDRGDEGGRRIDRR